MTAMKGDEHVGEHLEVPAPNGVWDGDQVSTQRGETREPHLLGTRSNLQETPNNFSGVYRLPDQTGILGVSPDGIPSCRLK
jgi:hypothetical protein